MCGEEAFLSYTDCLDGMYVASLQFMYNFIGSLHAVHSLYPSVL